MPKTLLVNTEQNVKVHHIVRFLSKTGMTDPNTGALSVEEVDAYVSEWLANGWKLFATHYLGTAPEGYGVLYIFVRE